MNKKFLFNCLNWDRNPKFAGAGPNSQISVVYVHSTLMYIYVHTCILLVFQKDFVKNLIKNLYFQGGERKSGRRTEN